MKPIRKLVIAVAGCGLALGMAASATASTLVVGGSLGSACYQDALFGHTDQESLDTCTRALEEGLLTIKEQAATHVNRGIILSGRGEYTKAFTDFDRALKLNPRLGEAFANRGSTLIRMGQYDRALTELDKALRFQLDEPARVYFNRAIVYEEMGDMRAAYEDYRKAADLMPKWNPPRMELARFHVTQ